MRPISEILTVFILFRYPISSWIRVTFDPGDRSVTTVEKQLREALENPETVRWPDTLVWKAQEEIDAEQLTDLGVEAQRALVILANDTAMAGDSRLYERIDGKFVPVRRHVRCGGIGKESPAAIEPGTDVPVKHVLNGDATTAANAVDVLYGIVRLEDHLELLQPAREQIERRIDEFDGRTRNNAERIIEAVAGANRD